MNAKICFECFYYAINNLPFQLYLKFQAYIVARLLRLVSDMNLRLLDRISPRIFLGQIELSGQIFLRLPNRVPRFCTRAFCCELDEIFHSVKKKITKKYKIMWKWPIALEEKFLLSKWWLLFVLWGQLKGENVNVHLSNKHFWPCKLQFVEIYAFTIL